MIASNSTLRHAHQLGLSADVMTMSGERIGNIANAIRDDLGMETN